jgi:biopolymer transport protein ExbB/TolQ
MTPSMLSPVSDVKSFWSMIQLGGGIGYLTIVVLGIGLFLALVKLLELINDARLTRHLMRLQFAALKVEEMPRQIQPAANSWMGQLLLSLVNLYHVSGSTQIIQQEISNYLQYVQDRFDSFRGRMAFLSDSAGALGLLGTVWGMFLTFFGGNLGDSEKILNGMGVALVTTLIGLVVSLILNFSTTEIFSLFNRRLDLITQKSDELRLRLMEIERGRSEAPAEFRGETFKPLEHVRSGMTKPSALPKRAATSPTKSESPEEQLPAPRLRVLAKLPERVPAGTRLPTALRVQVVSEEGAPLPRQSVVFIIAKGKSALGDGTRQLTVMTKENGEAVCDFTSATTPETDELIVALVNEPSQQWHTKIEIIPGQPAQAQIESGNDQAAAVGEMLSEPLRVLVTDRFNNPVPGVKVHFRVALGKGSFDKHGTQITKATNANGLAEVRYTLGPAAGFNSVVAEVEGIETPPIEFRALARG